MFLGLLIRLPIGNFIVIRYEYGFKITRVCAAIPVLENSPRVNFPPRPTAHHLLRPRSLISSLKVAIATTDKGRIDQPPPAPLAVFTTFSLSLERVLAFLSLYRLAILLFFFTVVVATLGRQISPYDCSAGCVHHSLSCLELAAAGSLSFPSTRYFSFF